MWEHGFESRWGQNFMRLEIIYEDKNLIALNKPAGVNFDWVLATRPELISVHRLDKDTSGIILFAKNQKIADYLKSLFQNHKITKTYLALVVGNIKNNSGTIDLAIGRSKKTPLKRVAIGEQRGKIREAVTDYKVLKRFTWVSDTQVEFTLVEAYPKTGRTHQIRSHFSAIGYPIVCDKLYAGKKFICPAGLTHQFLHASAIEFSLPSGSRLRLEADLPEDLKKTLDMLS
ncbi:MAG: Pseudouridine synthase [Candidatus Giovannonibacteria bacterium GW2011_GWC2_44_9]|uniref:Pseudouridine synthase n=3 Tax=Candidatus Giovannoniibacteriota TaxID=1752738 RepID=A0A0G1ITR9_9BACT|nr:MAG: Pseudouridine synthase [Candidatus Giovannonibacteria bacterium GW2011_GWB1_44_23]KKT62756.1 MAG: Pseudouridine synthase [Candidatus Giovannonibacteria bacterium GW2011_GWA1_44_29]KKT83782.1 MAG: Pseudouridine synthase [Candidatus Giovannonibacteria bacterium GW2011_GWC2_44_9]